jgi:hypothetical protein
MLLALVNGARIEFFSAWGGEDDAAKFKEKRQFARVFWVPEFRPPKYSLSQSKYSYVSYLDERFRALRPNSSGNMV